MTKIRTDNVKTAVFSQENFDSLLSEDIKLKEENNKLRKELEKNKKLYFLTVEHAIAIENGLMDRINDLTSWPSELREARQYNSCENKRTELIDKKNERENLLQENDTLKKDIDKLNLVLESNIQNNSITERAMSSELKEVTKISEHDNLTKIYNRAKFYEELYIQIEKSRINGNDLSVMMFDIDFFKRINDSFGHDIGDNILLKITELAREVVGPKYAFARWGGEEFMILLPDMNLLAAEELAEKLKKQIASHLFDKANKVTVSFGVTQFLKTDDFTLFLKRVDQALYKAKESGRNCVITL